MASVISVKPVARLALLIGLGFVALVSSCSPPTDGVAEPNPETGADVASGSADADVASGSADAAPGDADGQGKADAATGAVIHIDGYPRLPGETQDAPRFDRAVSALESDGVLQLSANTTYVFATEVHWKSHMQVVGADWSTVLKVTAKGVNCFRLTDVSHFVVKSLKIQGLPFSGDRTDGGGSAFRMSNVTDSILDGLRIQFYETNGIGLGGKSSRNVISNIVVTNTGAGIILYGGDVSYNTLDKITAQADQIGVSLNYAHHNTFGKVTTVDCDLMGFTLDGIGPGQGANFNTIGDLTVQRCGSDGGNASGGAGAYGGVYLGNASHDNVFKVTVSSDNFNNGLCIRGANKNTFETATFSGNKLNGIRVTASGSGHLFGTVGLTANGNVQDGIHLEVGSNTVGNAGAGAQARYNRGDGLSFDNADNNRVTKLVASNNGQIGVRVQPGSTGNVFKTLTATANAGGNTYWGSPVTLIP